MTPDPLLITCVYLRSVPEVAAIVDRRVYTKTPPTLADPWVRVHLIDDQPARASNALHLTHVLLQVDCYAGEPREDAQAEAWLLTSTVRAALHAMPAAAHTGAVVCNVTLGGTQMTPDGEVDPPRERGILSATLHLHA